MKIKGINLLTLILAILFMTACAKEVPPMQPTPPPDDDISLVPSKERTSPNPRKPYLYSGSVDVPVIEMLQNGLGGVCNLNVASSPGQAPVYKCDMPTWYLSQSASNLGTWQNLRGGLLLTHMRMCGAYGGYKPEEYQAKEREYFAYQVMQNGKKVWVYPYSTNDKVLRGCVPVNIL